VARRLIAGICWGAWLSLGERFAASRLLFSCSLRSSASLPPRELPHPQRHPRFAFPPRLPALAAEGFYEQERPLWWGNLCDECARLADMDATRSSQKNGTEA
jgi:hypothetical protein